MTRPPLPATIEREAFWALHDEPAHWREVIESIAAGYSRAAVRQVEEGTVLVGLVGDELVVKLYPPFLRDHFEFEREALGQLQGRLGVPTPTLIATGERDGWPYLVMTLLAGEPLTEAWPGLPEARKCNVLASIGKLTAEVHALSPAALVPFAPQWDQFLQGQRAGCRSRQQRTGLPAHLLAMLDDFVAGEVPSGSSVILTGEYTPMNLLHGAGRVVGMYDFGDGLVGPREYDWLGPLCFLAAGHADRCDALLEGYGAAPGRAWREPLLRLLLLHRYSNLPVQIACEGWQRAESFEALAALIWP